MKIICSAILLGVLVFSGCKKQDVQEPEKADEQQGNRKTDTDRDLNCYHGIDRQTRKELQQARAMTAKYQHIANAFKDQYEDINVVVPNMGYHFMRKPIVDATFDISKPEILVYNKNVKGDFELVAVEYAVPIELTPNKAPEGFTGEKDEWERNMGFGLWLLHAWVWKYNPEGVFHHTNPLVQLR